MSTAQQQVVSDTLAYLTTLSREGIRPNEARTRLRLLQTRHPGVQVDLVWEEEAYDGSVHYDALLRLAEDATLSLSYCEDRALPWPLRGVQRWSEKDLVRVNNTVLSVPQAIACLDFILGDKSTADRLVNTCLIEEELSRNPVEVTDAELQLGMDRFRAQHQLYTVAATHRWMQLRSMTHGHLEDLVADNVAVQKLRDRVVEGRIESYFESHRADFDIARIARIECTDHATALATHQRIAAGDMDFYSAAQSCFLAERGNSEGGKHGLFASIRRCEAPDKLRAAVFGGAADDDPSATHVVGGQVIRCLSIARAQLDESTRAVIAQSLFDDWLAERKQTARIEWNWGSPAPR